ncbi:hypothetical protein P6U16_06135 [Rhizobium sp. 32-5/1]|uniref:hypothetical protein n=1 Tax=Rhizobium sp. 32-5/1 TaxID=3019602 RepID=UPI00240D3882|nr:hypothetical protein [Rhizobium sp. 32-5/1]WEZ84239.1 hypothetical protein P6U16_06135 [Rhizobium sp. 32-5/1]
MQDRPTHDRPTRARQQRGAPCTLAEFKQRYNLGDEEALDLFTRFGPSEIELDLLMTAKGKRKAAKEPMG